MTKPSATASPELFQRLPQSTSGVVKAYVDAVDAITSWSAEKDRLAAKLRELHDAGSVPASLPLPDGRTLSLSAGRKATNYDEDVKLAIKALQERAKADGLCTESHGDPFWTIRAPRKG